MARQSLKKITVADVEYIAVALAKELMEWDEPIPDFGTRFPNVLESCLAVPFQTFERKSPYRGFWGKGAILFYLLIKNHPFQNGNKRIAVTTLLVFLSLNGYWIKTTPKNLYEFAKWVAGSGPERKSEVVAAIESFIKEHKK